jgi:ribosomal protein S27AE
MTDEELVQRWLDEAPEWVRDDYTSWHGTNERLAMATLVNWAETRVWCPSCGARYPVDPSDGDDDIVTYWGEGEPAEKTCPACGRTFFVKEHVRRTYTAEK